MTAETKARPQAYVVRAKRDDSRADSAPRQDVFTRLITPDGEYRVLSRKVFRDALRAADSMSAKTK